MFAFLFSFAVTLILASHGVAKFVEEHYLFCVVYAGATMLGAIITTNLFIIWREEIRKELRLKDDANFQKRNQKTS